MKMFGLEAKTRVHITVDVNETRVVYRFFRVFLLSLLCPTAEQKPPLSSTHLCGILEVQKIDGNVATL